MNEISLPSVDNPNSLVNANVLFERQASGLYLPTWQQGSGGAAHVNASPPKTINVGAGSDVTVYDPPLLGFRVGTTAGDVEVVDLYGDTTVIPAVQVGEIIAGGYTQILAANTTAVGITGWSA